MYFSDLKFTKLKRFSIKNIILSSIIRQRINNINLFIKNPFKVQNNIFKHLIKKGLNTKFGKDHLFNQITDYTTFKHQIPVRTYEELSPYIQESRKGKKNILWPGKVKWFAE